MLFPSFIMGLIAKTKLKFSSGLTVVRRDSPIGAPTMSRSKARITGPKTDMSQIPRDNVEEEGGDIEEEIDRVTSALENFAQPSSQAQARGSDRLDRLLARVEQMYGMLESHVQHTVDRFAYIQGQNIALSSQIEDMTMAQGSDSESD